MDKTLVSYFSERKNDPTETIILRKLDALDLEPILYKLVREYGWTIQEANQGAFLYKVFLFLIYLFPSEGLVPPKKVGKFWHQHILDTQKYAGDRQFIFGVFKHHFPYLGLRGEEDELLLRRKRTETRTLFRLVAGIELDPNSASDEASWCDIGCVQMGQDPGCYQSDPHCCLADHQPQNSRRPNREMLVRFINQNGLS